MEVDEPTTTRHILRELPRKKVALVLLVVVVNASLLVWIRGCRIGRKRAEESPWTGLVSFRPKGESFGSAEAPFVPPWEWTADEWRETVWPWR
jgi:hypothetical protein